MDLPSLVANTKEIQFRPVLERNGSIVAYRRILIAVIRDIQKAVREHVMPAFEANSLDGVVQDDRTGRRSRTEFTVVNQVIALSIDTAVEKVAILFDDDQRNHLRRLSGSIRQGTGIDVAPYLNLNREEVDQMVRMYIEQNTSLINSLSDDLIGKVEQAVYRAMLDRNTRHELAEILQNQYGIAAKRAELIATDQIASINYDFTRSRHTALGLDRYRWRTRGDGLVRPLHREINGREYVHGEPTDAEGGLPPGKNIRCRCVSVAVLPANSEAQARQKELREQLARTNREARAKAAREERRRREAR